MKKNLCIIALCLLLGAITFNSCQTPHKEFTENEKKTIADTIQMLTSRILNFASEANVDSTFQYLSQDSAALYFSGGMHYSYPGLISMFSDAYSKLKVQGFAIIHSQVDVLSPEVAVWIAYCKGKTLFKEGGRSEQFLCETWVWNKTPTGWRVVHYHESYLNYPDREECMKTEIALTKFSDEVKMKSVKPEDMKEELTGFLRKNPGILGSAFALIPKENALLFQYVYREDSKFFDMTLRKEFDYTRELWYRQPLLLNGPYWSDPYYDSGGAKMVMVTFSLPFYTRNNDLIGVITADLAVH